MKLMDSQHEVEELIRANTMTLIYFGGESCGVCRAVKPKLIELLKNYPKIVSGSVDTEKSIETAAAFSIFTIPVILVFIEGKEIIRAARHFSMLELEEKIARYYSAVFEG